MLVLVALPELVVPWHPLTFGQVISNCPNMCLGPPYTLITQGYCVWLLNFVREATNSTDRPTWEGLVVLPLGKGGGGGGGVSCNFVTHPSSSCAHYFESSVSFGTTIPVTHRDVPLHIHQDRLGFGPSVHIYP